MSEKEKVLLDEESLKVLEDLVEIAVRLKESGLLDMLKILAEKSTDIFAYISTEVPIHRLLALGDAATAAAAKLKPEEVVEMKINVEEATECLFKSLAAAKMTEVRPVSTLGLLRVLGDKDVQAGLGFLILLAKNLGACIRSKAQK
ncbi:hypothetical protein PYJP_16620 [Pyrofollis japonicus]|uniref:DUF1641 domain-containing protein n=1 Tax=Pyrofollis japonicus TaxID=3060460 RepID=UPI00295B6652|nr:DUF1641 domain-containing protein [Pyrofollis japonicus]BEP18310.1 hypothetical protein PYJP_16620 [Pyrofollis japonicus]